VFIDPPSPSRFAQQLGSGGSTPFALTNVMTETRTYVGLTGTHVFDGFKGLRMDTRYTGVPQEDGTVLWWLWWARPWALASR
jgi:hypothetical protein